MTSNRDRARWPVARSRTPPYEMSPKGWLERGARQAGKLREKHGKAWVINKLIYNAVPVGYLIHPGKKRRR